MDPIVFELLGSVLVGGMIWLTVLRRPKTTTLATMPELAVRKTRHVSSSRDRGSSPIKIKNRSAPRSMARPKRKTRTKTSASTSQSVPVASPEVAPPTLETCPSCGLQAPDKLLAEHFLGSPSHRNGPVKPVVETPIQTGADNELKEDDSKQSVRSLLQILVPPRAFGRRHANRSISPISSVVQDLGPGSRRHI